jgi:hypothetical protein
MEMQKAVIEWKLIYSYQMFVSYCSSPNGEGIGQLDKKYLGFL